MDRQFFKDLQRKADELKKAVSEITTITFPSEDEVDLAGSLSNRIDKKFPEQNDYKEIAKLAWMRYLAAPTIEDTFDSSDYDRDARELSLSHESLELHLFYKSGRLRGANIWGCLEIIEHDNDLSEFAKNVQPLQEALTLIFGEDPVVWGEFSPQYSHLPNSDKKRVAALVIETIKKFAE